MKSAVMYPEGSLEQVLANAREEAQVLQAHGHTTQARSIEKVTDQVAKAMRSYLATLSEKEAALRSGWTATRLRARFAEWESTGFAFLDSRGKRCYREIIVPVRTDESLARLAGTRGEPLKGSREAKESNG